MAVRLVCTSCGEKLHVGDECIGKKVRCPKCEQVLRVPDQRPDAPDPMLDLLTKASAYEEHSPTLPRAQPPVPNPPTEPMPRAPRKMAALIGGGALVAVVAVLLLVTLSRKTPGPVAQSPRTPPGQAPVAAPATTTTLAAPGAPVTASTLPPARQDIPPLPPDFPKTPAVDPKGEKPAASSAAALWETIWTPGASDTTLVEAYKSLFATAGSASFVATLTTTPLPLPAGSAAALEKALRETLTPDQCRPFVDLKSADHKRFVEPALMGLAVNRDRSAALRLLKEPGHARAAVEVACAALIDLGDRSPELAQAIQGKRAAAFPTLQQPANALALDPAAAQIVFAWLLQSGKAPQCRAAIEALANKPLSELAPNVQALLGARADLDAPTYHKALLLLATLDPDRLFAAYAAFAQKRLAVSSIGDADLPAPDSSRKRTGDDKKPPDPPATLAQFVCDGLEKLNRAKAGEPAMALLASPGVKTRTAAIDTLLDLDWIDATPRLIEMQTRLKTTVKIDPRKAPADYPPEARELLKLNEALDLSKLPRYHYKLRAAETYLKAREKGDEASPQARANTEANCQMVIDEKPGTATAQRARELLDKIRSTGPVAP